MSPILETRALRKSFDVGGRPLNAVRGVDLEIARGETFGLVGESGCGKSTLGRTIMGIHPPTSGEVIFEDAPVPTSGRARTRFTRRMQMVFQDPYSSLNPRMTVGEIIAEGPEIHRMGTRPERKERVRALMRAVGLDPTYENRYPHEFSGGQRQRIAIARALAVEPEMIVCDEPVSALDVSIQGQIVNLLRRLQEERGLTYLFVAHDLLMVRYISDRVGVMYLGRLVEVASSAELFARPLHPYTQALLSSVPIPDPVAERARVELTPEGELPSPFTELPGCAFRDRCPHAREACRSLRPELTEAAPGHRVMCVLHGTPSD
jgi:oligopeptide/dipeptide ABC transporter ATP-binding protein